MSNQKLTLIPLFIILLILPVSFILGQQQQKLSRPKAQESTSSISGYYRCPSNSIREALNAPWNYNRGQITLNITNRLTSGDPYILYDVQGLTNNLLEMTASCADTAILQQLVKMYLLAYPHLQTNTSGYKQWSCSSSDCADYRGQTKETVLVSSQFIYLLSRTANILASLPTDSLTPSMHEFLQKYIPVIANDHLHRWITDTTAFSRNIYNCNSPGYYNHHQFLSKLLNREFGDTPTYCNIVTDTDMWIIAASAELLAADNRSNLIVLTPEQVNELHDHVALGSQLLQSRLTETSLTNFEGNPVTGLDFDRGMWRDYRDNAYAGYTGRAFPQEGDRLTSPTVGWDFSHAQRFVPVFTTLLNTRFATDQKFPDNSVLVKLTNQVAYQIFNKDFARPLFANYWDGTNGYYRVNYSGRVGFGYAPSDLSIAFPTGGYGLWGLFNPDIDRIMDAVWSVISSTDAQVVEFRNEHYGRFYNNYLRTTAANWDKNTSTNFIKMISTVRAFLPNTPTPTPTGCRRQAQGDANCDGEIDLIDFNLWRQQFTTGIAGTADFNSDNKVDLVDFNTWRINLF